MYHGSHCEQEPLAVSSKLYGLTGLVLELSLVLEALLSVLTTDHFLKNLNLLLPHSYDLLMSLLFVPQIMHVSNMWVPYRGGLEEKPNSASHLSPRQVLVQQAPIVPAHICSLVSEHQAGAGQ